MMESTHKVVEIANNWLWRRTLHFIGISFI